MFARNTIAVLALAATVTAHGFVTSPTPRTTGPAYSAACGQAIFNTQNSDHGGNVQDLLQKRGEGFDASKCNLWLCKGYQFDDNLASIQQFTPGQVLPIKVNIVAPHTGTANVSVVDLASNSVIGSELIFFNDYASVHHPAVAHDSNFEVTIPDLAGKCTKPGQCALQWYWDSREVNQTYESCIDFPSSSPAAPAPSSSPAAPSPAPATTQPAATPTASPIDTYEPEYPATSAAPISTQEPTPTAAPAPKCRKRM
ncbi:uncharacterized protein EV422DRAFT_550348 [Fimicolochytrium jonesii]|uniref:uncharacterized protein n=1 Tax=Fimicolochytrium jonesii TaxID=1396493 RepID=UPI0022FEBE03|nr:uncharacterized protein EV422DRAFT_550348 [Fimicolochytrium jonesii]KAI8822442.1 hypothetical protein EV422DRAFT_550348 [Fimicolochytrium jonesii]